MGKISQKNVFFTPSLNIIAVFFVYLYLNLYLLVFCSTPHNPLTSPLCKDDPDSQPLTPCAGATVAKRSDSLHFDFYSFLPCRTLTIPDLAIWGNEFTHICSWKTTFLWSVCILFLYFCISSVNLYFCFLYFLQRREY